MRKLLCRIQIRSLTSLKLLLMVGVIFLSSEGLVVLE
jgi:hypothetical protein